MLQSMTGYGQATLQTSELYVYATIKTLNGKYLDIQFNLPQVLFIQEATWRKWLAEKLLRGKVAFSITCIYKNQAAKGEINQAVLKDYYDTLLQIAKELGATTDLLTCALNLPGVVLPSIKTPFPTTYLGQVNQVVEEALAKCIASRQAEGAALGAQLTDCLAIMRAKLAEIELHAPKRASALRARLKEKISLRENSVDANRWEQELLYYLEKLDIEEEKIRLKSHLAYFEKSMHQQAMVSNKLSFIAQEIGRELNTIGAKAQDATLQHLIVEMKQVLGQIREQLQNLV